MKLIYRGKVRDMYEVDKESLLMVATDRISCFDYILPTAIPGKGVILSEISRFWFEYLDDIVENHLVMGTVTGQENALLIRKANRIDIECIVRGYISGSAWKEYSEKGKIGGKKYPKGLKESCRLPEAIFTPSTKAPDGEHDINITEEEAIKITGAQVYYFIKKKSLDLYKKAADYAESRGIIIADTKFEFGFVKNRIVLIDEALTPDSSRFWDLKKYLPGRSQESFDKQFVRDYLEKIKWAKKPPAPELPLEIVERTREKYLEAKNRLLRA